MRKERTASELAGFADRLEAAAKSIRNAIAQMSDAEMPSALVHGETVSNRYIPDVMEWADKIEVDVRAQVRAHLDGRASRAHQDKAENDARKKAEKAGRK